MKETPASAVKEQKQEKAEDAMPSEDALAQTWKTLPSLYESMPRMASLLSNAELRFAEEDGVKVVILTVISEAQKQWLRDSQHQRKIEGVLRTGTNSSKVRLEIEVKPEEEQEQKIYMPAEKAKDLMESNSEVREFISDLGLDIR